MPLTAHPTPAYPIPVTATSVTGRRNPWNLKGASAPPLQALFLCLQSLSGGRCGAAVRLAGVLSDRFPTPASFATIPVGRDTANSDFFLKGVCHYV